MAILTDEEIIKIVYEDKPNLFVEGVREPVDWFSKDSPVQPSSLDISIGGIYIPGSQLGKKGGEGDPYEEYILEPGQTAVVTSKEKFIFPNNIAAIGFPPSRLSIKGLLMTNPGHIDPGSDNELHFTVINMAKKPIDLRVGDEIFSVLFFKLKQNARKGLKQRVSEESPELKIYKMQDYLDRLSPDFLNIKERAEQITENWIERENIRIKRREVWKGVVVSVVAGVIITAFGWLYYWTAPLREDFRKIKQDVAVIKNQLDNEAIKFRLDKLETIVETRLGPKKPH